MVETMIACIHERFAVVVVRLSYILVVFTHFNLGLAKKVYHENAENVQDNEMKVRCQDIENYLLLMYRMK